MSSVHVTCLRFAHTVCRLVARRRANLWGAVNPDEDPRPTVAMVGDISTYYARREYAGYKALAWMMATPKVRLERLYFSNKPQSEEDAKHAKMRLKFTLPTADRTATCDAFIDFTTAGTVQQIFVDSRAFSKDGDGEVALIAAQSCVMFLLMEVSKLMVVADVMRHPMSYLLMHQPKLRVKIKGGTECNLFRVLWENNDIMKKHEHGHDLCAIPSKLYGEGRYFLAKELSGFGEATKPTAVRWEAPDTKVIC